MKIVNSSNKYVKLAFRYDGNRVLIPFERPVDRFWWYRIFIKPSGHLVALKEMDDAKKDWKFLCSINLDQMYPGMTF